MKREEFLSLFRPLFPITFRWAYSTLITREEGNQVVITFDYDEETGRIWCLIMLFNGFPVDAAAEGIQLQICEGDKVLATLSTSRRGQCWFEPKEQPASGTYLNLILVP